MGTQHPELLPEQPRTPGEVRPQPALERMPLWRIIGCTMAMCGVQMCYAAQINLGTPHLLLLGISERAVSFAWLAGPLSGLIVQPLVGRASDGCTSKLGRRRPFLIAGTVLTSAALLLFSNALPVAKLLVGEASARTLALSFAIFAFFLVDFSIQIVQAPLRALVTDIVPKSQRALANSWLGVFTGLGIFLGGLLTSLKLTTLIPVFRTDVQALFAISTIVLIATVAVSVATTKEHNFSSYTSVAPSGDRQEGELPRGIADALRLLPQPFWRVFAVQLCTWFGFFTLFVYVNSWVGRNIYLGDGTAPPSSEARKTFDLGVKLGGKGNAIMSLVTLTYALVLPYLLKIFGIAPVYAFSQLIEAACLLSTPLLRGTQGQDKPSGLLRALTLLDIGLFGVVWATTMGIPWTLIGDALESDPWYSQRVGLFQTLFNASQSFPQLIVAAVVAPAVLSVSRNDPAFVMFAGGMFAAFGAVLVIVLRVGDTTLQNPKTGASQAVGPS